MNNFAIAPRRPRGRDHLNPLLPHLRDRVFAALGPHFVGLARDTEGHTHLLHFRVPQISDDLHEVCKVRRPTTSLHNNAVSGAGAGAPRDCHD